MHAEEFRRKLGILHHAAVGVILVRTREPFRAIESIRDFTFADPENLEFKVWNIVYGWATYDRETPDEKPTTDNTFDPLAALKNINGLGETNSDNAFPCGVYCMMYPHMVNLAKNPALISAVKEYSKVFPEINKTLVLITTGAFELPSELQDDVVILEFDVPSYRELGLTYDRLVGDVSEHNRPTFSDEDKDKIVASMAGMTAHEAEGSLARALVSLQKDLPNISSKDVSSLVMDVKTEMVKRSHVLSVVETEDMSQVGGLENLKEWARKRAQCFSEEAFRYGIRPPKGVALIGPPGTGKSLAAGAMAYMLGLPLVRFDVGSVFQSLVGDSERNVREALALVDAMSPCVLMLDEADKAFQQTSGGDSGVGQRVLGSFLSWMQDGKKPVFCVVTANRVENMPSEFLRRGRLSEIFSVSIPTEEEREAIFKIHLSKRGVDPDSVKGLSSAVEGSNGYVGSELESAVEDAMIDAFTEKKDLTGELICEQLSYLVPLSEAFKDQFATMRAWAENNARPANAGSSTKPKKAVKKSRSRALDDGSAPKGRRMNLDGV
jgi:SpoVK/Ycf46/Vps4 family AAA+-type ATPase